MTYNMVKQIYIYVILAQSKLVNNANLCNHCPYNKKFENFTYDEWEEYKKQTL